MSMQFFTYSSSFFFERGGSVPQIDITYHTFGTLNEKKDNVIWVCHALTGSSDIMSWWQDIFNDESPISPKKFFIICANIIGGCYGSTGPLSINPITQQPYYHSFPLITVRDMVKAHQILAAHLHIEKIYLLMGPSLGGHQCMEWVLDKQQIQIEHLLLLNTNAKHSAWGIGFSSTQRMAIELDPTWKENAPYAGMEGMKVARAMAVLSYRSYDSYIKTQSETDMDIYDNFKVTHYQIYQGVKLYNRFNAFSYWYLSKAIDSHNVASHRNASIPEVLHQIKCKTLVLGVSSDLLYPISEQIFLAKHIPHATFHIIDSMSGHDGFLIESARIKTIIGQFLTNTPN